MPADPSIYAQLQPARINTPFENLSQILTLRQQQESQRALEEQRRAIAEQRQAQTQLLQQQQTDTSTIDQAIGQGGSEQDILARIPGHLRARIQEQFQKAHEYDQKVKDAKAAAEKAEIDYAAHLASSVLAWKDHGPEAMLNAAQVALKTAADHGHDVSGLQQALQQDPGSLETRLNAVIALSKGPQAPQAPHVLSPGQELRDPTGKLLATGPPKEPTKPASAQEFEYRNSLTPDQRAAYDKYQNEDANRHRPVTSVSLAGTNPEQDRKDNARQLVRGNLLPSMLSKRGSDYNALLAEANRISLEENGKPINLTKLQLDYDGAKRFVSTMNGSQMVRFHGLAQSVVNTIDEVQTLADALKQGSVQKWNAAKRSTIQQVYGNTAQSELAARYVGAVNTLKEEFANLAQGGFAPTEAAWKLANDQINKDFGFRDMAASLNEVQRLINYRVSAISDQQPYRLPGGGPPSPTETLSKTPPANETPDQRLKRLLGGG